MIRRSNSIKRVPTGIEGFDGLIEGGFPIGSVNLISGPSGSAKSIFCLHFAFNGASMFGESSIYVTLEETKESLRETLMSFGKNPTEIETNSLLTLIDLGELRRLEEEEFLSFENLTSILEGAIDAVEAKRLVVDSLAAIGLQQPDSASFRRGLFRFGRFLKQKGITSLLVTESLENGPLTRFGVEQFIADSFIFLDLENVKGELARSIVVRKMRLTHHDSAVHPFLITDRGLKISGDVKITGGV